MDGVRPPPEAQPLIDDALREMGRSILPREETTTVDEDNARRRGLDDVGDAREHVARRNVFVFVVVVVVFC